MYTDFENWLTSGSSTTPYLLREGVWTHILIRVEKNADFEYLFCQKKYGVKSSVVREAPFEYAGIYCRKDGLLYDAQFCLGDVDQGSTSAANRDAQILLEQLKNTVRGKVEAIIGNDRNHLEVKQLSDSYLLNRLDSTNRYGAAGTARRLFLDAADPELPVFRCYYDPDPWEEENLLSYILDPERYAEREAAAFMATHQEEMLFTFLWNDLVVKEYQAILADTGNPVHLVKRIMAVMRSTDAKTVNVAIRKDGTDFSFKTDACPLQGDCRYDYSCSAMIASDRRKFYQTFGKSASYGPQDIIRITYGKKVLYSRDCPHR